jgi:hypothetical protein
VNILERDNGALLGRNINACDTGHSVSPKRRSNAPWVEPEALLRIHDCTRAALNESFIYSHKTQ